MLNLFVFGALWLSSTAFVLPGFPIHINYNASDEVLSAVSDTLATYFKNEYMQFLSTGVESGTLRQMSASLAGLHNRKDLFSKSFDELDSSNQLFACTSCRLTANIVAHMALDENGKFNDEEVARSITLDLCDRWDMGTPETCGGLFEAHYDLLMYIAKHSVMDTRSFCALFMGYGYCTVKSPEYKWSLDIDSNGPAITGHKSVIPNINAADVRILHLTDIHYDPLYVPGSLAECEESLCCQRHKDVAEGSTKAAGYWGDYRHCDSPWHMIENALEHIKATHTNLDYIYMTGDIVDHMMWGTSREKNMEVISKFMNKLMEVFPNTPIFACIGNHEPHPLNVFSPNDVPEFANSNWLYQHLYSIWSKWLPADTEQTILKGGYYTVSPNPGFRIISLNNNDCYTMNWWLFYNGTDKQPQLIWLHDTLLAAEQANEYVHILAHMPSGDSTCWTVWSHEYNRIIERFSHIISGIFNGHTHKDEMNLYYSSNGYAIGISWNGGSLTPWSNRNPMYRVYDVESESMQVVDHETWIFDLDEANKLGSSQVPKWFKEYKFSEEFTNDLSPAGIHELLEKMADTPDLVRKFWRYKHASGVQTQSGCGTGCLLNTICRIVTTIFDERTRCNVLMDRLSIAIRNEKTN